MTTAEPATTNPAPTESRPTATPTPALPIIAAPTSARPHSNRTTAAAAAIALLTALLCTVFALPTKATTLSAARPTAAATSAIKANTDVNTGRPLTSTTGSGTESPSEQHQVASRPTNSSGDLVFAGLCLAAIVATAGGVLAYTARNRRTQNSDPTH
jgi:hypothetical protein